VKDSLSPWSDTTIGEQCVVIAGQSPKGKYYNNTGEGLPFYQGKKEFGEKFIGAPSKWTSHTTKEAFEGDILMSVRAPVGPINFSTQKVCIGRGLASIRAVFCIIEIPRVAIRNSPLLQRDFPQFCNIEVEGFGTH